MRGVNSQPLAFERERSRSIISKLPRVSFADRSRCIHTQALAKYSLHPGVKRKAAEQARPQLVLSGAQPL